MLLFALLLALLGAVLPTIVYVSIAWWLDRYEKEPWWLLALTFVWGAVPAIILSIIFECVLSVPMVAAAPGADVSVVTTAVIAPLVEETFKAAPLLMVFLFFRREFDGLMDGLLYGALVGFGFAMTENFFYIIGAWSAGGLPALVLVTFLRTVVFGLMHALWSSMFGLGLGIARYTPSRELAIAAPIGGLLLGMLLHAVHNFSAVQGGLLVLVMLGSYAFGCVGWLILVIFAGLREAAWIREELVEEVAAGLLSPDQARASARYRSRVSSRWAALWERGFGHAHQLGHLYALAAELAFKKRQHAIHPEQAYAIEIASLRNEIVEVQRRLATTA